METSSMNWKVGGVEQGGEMPQLRCFVPLTTVRRNRASSLTSLRFVRDDGRCGGQKWRRRYCLPIATVRLSPPLLIPILCECGSFRRSEAKEESRTININKNKQK